MDGPANLDPIVAAAIAADWGPVHVAVSSRGVVAVELSTTAEAFGAGIVRRRRRPIEWASSGPPTPLLATVIAVLEQTLAGEPGSAALLATLPLDLDDRPAWDQAVLAAVRAIPRGEVRSYGQIAQAIGRPRAARAVGGAVGRNPVAMLVPCHRVVAGDGTLGGYGGGWWGDRDRLLELKARLLADEGVELPRSRPRSHRGRGSG